MSIAAALLPSGAGYRGISTRSSRRRQSCGALGSQTMSFYAARSSADRPIRPRNGCTPTRVGRKVSRRLNGMFAFVIYDGHSQSVFAACQGSLRSQLSGPSRTRQSPAAIATPIQLAPPACQPGLPTTYFPGLYLNNLCFTHLGPGVSAYGESLIAYNGSRGDSVRGSR